jgi:hypothetical protein
MLRIVSALDQVQRDRVPDSNQAAFRKPANAEATQLIPTPHGHVERGWTPPSAPKHSAPVPIAGTRWVAGSPGGSPDRQCFLVGVREVERHANPARRHCFAHDIVICCSSEAGVMLLCQPEGNVRHGRRRYARWAGNPRNVRRRKGKYKCFDVAALRRSDGLSGAMWGPAYLLDIARCAAPNGPDAHPPSYCVYWSPAPSRWRLPARGSPPEVRSSWRTSRTSRASAAARAPAP